MRCRQVYTDTAPPKQSIKLLNLIFTIMPRCAKLTWMKKPIVFIYTFSDKVDLTAKALLEEGIVSRCPIIVIGHMKVL